MSVGWESGLLGCVAGFAGFIASVRLVMLPADLLLRGEPTLTADEFKRAQPRRAWLVDRFPFITFALAVMMLGLFAVPVKWYIDPALADLDPATRWPIECGVFAFIFFQWIFLPLAGLELATGMTLSFRGQAPKASQAPQGQQSPGVICSPEVWRAGVLRLALTLAAFGAAAGVVEAFRP